MEIKLRIIGMLFAPLLILGAAWLLESAARRVHSMIGRTGGIARRLLPELRNARHASMVNNFSGPKENSLGGR